MKYKNLYSVLGGGRDPFGCFKQTYPVWKLKDIEKDGVLLINGGGDISPSIYGQKCNKYCHSDNLPNERDTFELACIDHALKLEIPILGICRGAQLICAVDGGILIQHIDGHVGTSHTVVDNEGNVYKSNSAHHQMMVPNKDNENEILAWDNRTVMGVDKDNNEFEVHSVPEIVYFPKMKALGIQGHPEWLENHHPYVRYFTSLIEKLLLKE